MLEILNILSFWCHIPLKKLIYLFIDCWTTNFALLSVFNIIIYDVYRKTYKSCIKTLKIGKFWSFCYFRDHFRRFQKNPKIPTNTYRTMLTLCELNPVGNARQFEYKLVYSLYKHRI